MSEDDNVVTIEITRKLKNKLSEKIIYNIWNLKQAVIILFGEKLDKSIEYITTYETLTIL